MRLLKFFAAPAIGTVMALTISCASYAASKVNTLLLDVKGGQVVIELLPDSAPMHVKRITSLANKGFYDGLKFHRVIPGFMAQTGDPNGNGTGGSSEPDLKAEFNKVPFVRGTLGMARSSNPDSANSAVLYYVCLSTAFGWSIHRVWKGGEGHGICGRHQKRYAGRQRFGERPR